MFYDFLPVPCHQRKGAPASAQTAEQVAAGASMLDVEVANGAVAFAWDTLPFGFMNMLINFIQVVEANIECTTGATSNRRSWSSTRHYNFVRSRLEALMGQSNAHHGMHTERIRRLQEHGLAAVVFFQHLDGGSHGMTAEAVGRIVVPDQALALTAARDLARQLAQYDDGALSDVAAAVRCKALDTALLALHPDLVKRVNHVKQQFDYVADLRGPVHFDVETRRLYANILGDPLVFRRLGLDLNRSPRLVTVRFHESTQWRARMFRDIFGPKSAVLFNFGGADPGFNVIQTITQLYPYVVWALGDGAHKHISSVSRRRDLVLRDIKEHEMLMEATDYDTSPGLKDLHENLKVALHDSAHRVLLERHRDAARARSSVAQVMRLIRDTAMPAFLQANQRRNANKLSAQLSGRFGMLGVPLLQKLLKSRSHANPSQFTTHMVLETGTTKICINCGVSNPNVGGNRTFVCKRPACQWIGSRDVDASNKIIRADLVIRQLVYDFIFHHSDEFQIQLQHQQDGPQRSSMLRFFAAFS